MDNSPHDASFEALAGRALAPALFLATVGAAIVPLFFFGCYYNSDWLLHLWPTGFLANALKYRHELAYMIHSEPDLVSFPTVVFYGNWFFVLTSLVGSALGAEAGMRLVCALVLGIQFVMVARATRAAMRTKDNTWGAIVATLVGCAIYPLTNLYHRAAVPEYFATVCVMITVCSWVCLWRASSRAEMAREGALGAFFAALATGSHPITTLYSVLLVGPFLLTFFFGWRGVARELRTALLVTIAGMSAFVLLANGPYFYMLAKYSSQVGVSQALGQGIALTLFPDRSDSLVGRLFPLPYDKGSLLMGTKLVTPYFELQLNMPLFFLLAFVAAQGCFARPRDAAGESG